MTSLLQQLENNEAILLMYLADELGAEDRREVEQMLSRDPALAAELEKIRTAQEAVTAAMGRLDEANPLRLSTPAAVRQVSRLMKQWQVDRLARRPAAVGRRGLRLQWWTYPAAGSAVAAGLLIGLMVWWGMKPDNSIVTTQPTPESTLVASNDQNQNSQPVQADSAEENSGLSDAEQQASALAQRSNDVASTATIFLTEPVQ